MNLSKAETAALRALQESQYQDGIIDRYGRVVTDGGVTKFAPETWLRLVSKGLIEGRKGERRLFLTPLGRETLT